MKSEIEKYEKIERFLSGTISEEEKKEIELLIVKDPHFAKEVEQHKLVFNFIIDSSIAGVREQMRTIHDKKIRKIRINRRIRVGIAITTGVVVIGLIAYSLFTRKKNTEESIPMIPVPEKSQSIITHPIKSSANKIIPVSESKNQNPIVEKGMTEQDRVSRPIITEKMSQTLNDGNSEIIKTIANSSASFQDKPDENIPADQAAKKSEEVNLLPENIVYDCSQVSLFGNVTTEKSCQDKATGVLLIEETSITGGTPPYSVSVDNQTSYHSGLRFDQLLPSRYSVWIRDINNCTTWLGSYLIESVDCTIQDIFAPDKGEKWVVPNNEKPCQLKIFNQGGILVFETIIDFAGKSTWDGTTRSGALLLMGVYTYVIKLEDGTILKGNVTIIR